MNLLPAYINHKFGQDSRRYMRLIGAGRDGCDLIRVRDTSKYSPRECARQGKR